ncbi:MAG: hypothetical protein HC767_07885 [Akkermansiaceae bacterium]|nr:hypothetical protein [Akkermansiaceae bacterium]
MSRSFAKSPCVKNWMSPLAASSFDQTLQRVRHLVKAESLGRDRFSERSF